MSNRLERLAAFLGLLMLCIGLHWRSGTFKSEFGRYSDEGMHYVTGLMIRDWAVSDEWSTPIRFAKNFYLHFPKVGLGNWPPVFPLIQSLWELFAGESRASLMLFMMILTAILATQVYRLGSRYYSKLLAFLVAAILMMTALTQAQTSMVMAEIPLALFSLLAMWRFTRWIETETWSNALWFVLWSLAAIFTKGNAWVIALAAPASLVICGRLDRVRSLQLWAIGALIALPTVPYTIITMRVVSNGWNTRAFPGIVYTIRSLGVHAWFGVEIFGVLLTVVALLGLWDRTFRLGKSKDPFWISMACYAAAILFFHALIPTSIEPRKIYQIAPVISLFLGAGLDWMSRVIAVRGWLSPDPAKYAVAVGAAVYFLGIVFSSISPYAPGFVPVVEQMLARDDRRNAAILISSSPLLDDSEAALIAEWASRERNAGTYLARGTKLLSRATGNADGGVDYPPFFQNVEELQNGLNAVPVSYLILHTRPAPRSYPHHALLKQLVAERPQLWERIYNHRSASGFDELEIYRSRQDWRGVAVKMSVDLMDKIGDRVGTGTQ